MCPTCPFRGQWKPYGVHCVPANQVRTHLLAYRDLHCDVGPWEPGQCHDEPEKACAGWEADEAAQAREEALQT